MDQTLDLKPGNRRLAVDRLSDIHRQLDRRRDDRPTRRSRISVFEHVFPDDVYAQMLANMPEATDYRPMHGRSKGHDLTDGTHTRVKIDLFPEYIRHLPPQKRAVWDLVGRALCSQPVKEAFKRRLAAPLARRFGKRKVGMYPIPILTRDIPGYLITPHTDTRWKGITVQLYLPRDRSTAHIGTIFHDKLADGRCGAKAKQMIVRAEFRLRLRRRHRYLAFGRSGRAGSEDPRQHLAYLFRRSGGVAIVPQSRQAIRQFRPQRSPQQAAVERSPSIKAALSRPRTCWQHGHPQTPPHHSSMRSCSMPLLRC